MQFAVIEFEVDNSVDVVDVGKIIVCDNEILKSGQFVIVTYKKDTGTTGHSYSGTILSLHETIENAESALEDVLNDISHDPKSPSLGRGKRVRRKKGIESDDDEERKSGGKDDVDPKLLRNKAEQSTLLKINKNTTFSKQFHSNSLYDSDESQDELIEKKVFTKLQKKYDDIKKHSVNIEKFNDLKQKYEILNKKLEKIENINFRLQEEILAKMSRINNVVEPKSPATGPIRSLSFSPLVTKQSLQSSHDGNLLSQPLAAPLSPDHDNELVEFKSSGESPAQGSSEKFELRRDKIMLAKTQVKPGRLGDSQYAKNLAAVLWEPQVLANRSVTGKVSNAVKGVSPKPQLTPQKLDLLKRLFRERIKEEVPQPSEIEVVLRCAAVNSFISQKIATLNRKCVTRKGCNS